MIAARSIVVLLAYLTCMHPLTVMAGLVPAPFFSCTDYHCDQGETVTLSEEQWHRVVSLLPAAETPAEERQQIRRAIALLETEVGAITGTWRDLAKNVAGAGLPGQLDCISESKNTTTYLQLLSRHGLLRWHEVEERRSRQPWILNVHWSAVIRDLDTGRQYAVDSWFLDNGELPFIQPLEQWMAGRRFDSSRESPGQQ
jgi:hypothetical protein